VTLPEYVEKAMVSARIAPAALRQPETVEALVQEGMAIIRHDVMAASRLAAAAGKLARQLKDVRGEGLASRLSGHSELLRGKAARAVPHYEAARRSFAEHPDERAATAVAMLQALSYVGNYVRAFEVAGEALAHFQSIGDGFRAARVQANLANAHYRLDRLAEAQEHYEAAMPVLAAAGAIADLAIVARNYGVCLMGLLALDRAEAMYGQARAVFEHVGDRSLVLEIDLNRAYLLGRRGFLREALVAYRQLRHELPEELGFEIGHSFLDQADFMLDAGLWTDALAAANRAADIFDKLDTRFEKGKARLLAGMALVRSGRAAEAKATLDEARGLIRKVPNHNWHALVHQAYAEYWTALDRPRAALTQLLRAEAQGPTDERLPSIRQALGDLALDLGETALFTRLAPTPTLNAKSARQRGDLELAAAWARTALSEYDAHRDRIGGARLRQAAAVAQTKILRECFRALGDAKERHEVVARIKNQTLSEIALSPESLPFGSDLSLLRSRLYSGESEEALTTALHEAQSLATGSIPSPTELGPVPDGTQILELFSDQGRLYAFVIRGSDVQEVLLGQVEEFARMARFFRFHLARDRTRGTDRIWAVLSQVARCFAPVLGGTGNLVIARDDPLSAIPFHALVPGQQVLYAPSAASWLALRRRRSLATGALVMGVGDALAPHIDKEVQMVSDRLGVQITWPAAFEAAAPAARVLHIAAHGIVREDRPLFSAMKLGDRDLSVFDVVRLRLSAELTVLSGCSTGVSVPGELRDAEGFIEAFLGAGSQTVIASLWAVSDAVTLEWMDVFYSKIDQGLMFAYQSASANIAQRHPHPADWAAFAMFGAPPESAPSENSG